MNVDKIVTVKEDLDIIGATLLSIEEAKQLPIKLRRYHNWWWLRSPGYFSNYAVLVNSDNSIYGYGGSVDYRDSVVRPALEISILESSNLKIGDQFEFGEKLFQIVSSNLAFCLSDIGKHCFREDWQAQDANIYEKSDVNRYIDEWFEQNRSN